MSASAIHFQCSPLSIKIYGNIKCIKSIPVQKYFASRKANILSTLSTVFSVQRNDYIPLFTVRNSSDKFDFGRHT
ncbi:hypothetical protein XELAEV_18020546mg [Xenopus laevis]|uniref:Uncharacterized protein n=1 Tax=Xenopus laevis TaxID=8355 RepID=A0A974D9W4_XENLA|nr:hypothetical protein XELAEV_18020546mg [Xenopus laevis]